MQSFGALYDPSELCHSSFVRMAGLVKAEQEVAHIAILCLQKHWNVTVFVEEVQRLTVEQVITDPTRSHRSYQAALGVVLQ